MGDELSDRSRALQQKKNTKKKKDIRRARAGLEQLNKSSLGAESRQMIFPALCTQAIRSSHALLVLSWRAVRLSFVNHRQWHRTRFGRVIAVPNNSEGLPFNAAEVTEPEQFRMCRT